MLVTHSDFDYAEELEGYNINDVDELRVFEDHPICSFVREID